jgi:hypothetical protein
MRFLPGHRLHAHDCLTCCGLLVQDVKAELAELRGKVEELTTLLRKAVPSLAETAQTASN